ncbi:MAG TPA: HlyD family type I secretion periplasmic adaptor subunit [Methylotenera sp.]|nr:HlyD family type I secretion periplasmic adaptor subunit [Methylotenera sp.]HPH08547.1 HlyD family type I secretion periplasmic adaptor subunit [Methylotenera sp.]HPM48681.1 HlyD family type I secretion periplasmic adaptor subunit [Methylotenera sp.]
MNRLKMHLAIQNNSSKSPQLQVVDATQQLDQYANNKAPNRLGLFVLLFGLVGFLLWAGFAPLDEGVPTEAVVNVASNHKVVQHLSGGIVKTLNVKEGQEVKAGNVLLTLDDAVIKARYEESKQKYMGIRAQESRLIAEKNGANTVNFHEDLIKNQADVDVQKHMINQTQLLQARQSAFSAEIMAIKESIQGQNAQIEGDQGVLASYQSQLELLKEQLVGIKPLVQEGYAPRNQQNDLEQKIAQAIGQIANTQASIVRSKRTISELTQRLMIRQQNEKKEVDTEMAQVNLAVLSEAAKFKALTDELGRISLLAPASGQIIGLQVHTIGAVIQPGQKIMDIIPLGEPLILDARIPPNLIDKVHAGQHADVRFSTFSNTPQLLVEGKVESVSKDLLTDTSTNPAQVTASYYLAKISITSAGLKVLGDRQLQAGMPVQVVIKTGERTLLTYLLHPLTKRIAASMKEE